MNPETSLVCLDCGVTYTMPESEYQRFKQLAETITDFKMPRRCSDCRRARRNQAPPAPKLELVHQPSQSTPVRGYSADLLKPAAQEASKDEILLVLATKDFEELVNGRPVVWRGVRVVLADIGLSTMKKAIEEVELDRAKKIVKTNGH